MHTKQSKQSAETWFQQVTEALKIRLTHRIVLGLSIIAAVLAWHLTNCNFEVRNQDRFTYEVAQIRERIDKRMIQYEQVLRGGIALYRSSDHVSREEWQNYVDACQVLQHHPGIQAMAVSMVIPKSELDQHIEKIRSEGFEDYTVHPTGQRDKYTAIVFLEPFDWRNKRAFGYDMYSEPVRRKAMDRATETGEPSISGKITLVQETSDNVQAGVLCYLPIYKKGVNVDGINARRQAIKGWVYAAFRFDNLMAGIVGVESSDVAFKIFDTNSTDPEHLLYDSDSNSEYDSSSIQHFTSLSNANISGREWTILFAAKPNFLDPNQTAFSSLVAIGGLLFNLLLFAVMRSLSQQRERAYELASLMTVGFENSESRNQLILENASEAILSVSESGEILAANKAAHKVFAARQSLLNVDLDQLIPDLKFDDELNADLRSGDGGNGIKIRCLHEDGSSFPGRASIGNLGTDEKSGYIVIVRDETARVEAEAMQRETTKQLVAASHKAGKAEVATGVLHNVGNAINSVNVSATLLLQQVNASPVDKLSKTYSVIKEHESDLVSFFQNDAKAIHFPKFLEKLTETFHEIRNKQIDEIDSLMKSVQHIKEVVTMQQSSAKKQFDAETVLPCELFEDAVKMNSSNLHGSKISVVREYESVPHVALRKHDVMQILINLIKNAEQAIDISKNTNRTIQLSLQAIGESLIYSVTDTGIGISEQHLGNIFQHGFTTKETGHGFGLHSSRNTAKAMGGDLEVESQGEGLGATFTLTIPISSKQKTPPESNVHDSNQLAMLPDHIANHEYSVVQNINY